jgi:hypothetical protein
MTCSCTNTTTITYAIKKAGSGYRIHGPNGAVLTSCGGTLNVVPPGGYDCIRLVFEYTEAKSVDELLPLISVGTCPCETDSGPTSAGGQQFIGRFKIPKERATCTYLWTLKASQPPCRIDIVIHAP